VADPSVPEPEVGVETIITRMKGLSERAEEFSPEERTKRFEHVESQSAEELPAQAAAQAAQAQALLKSDISHFVEDATFLYQDFAKRGEISDIPTFRVQVRHNFLFDIPCKNENYKTECLYHVYSGNLHHIFVDTF
jgi:hypothetical protein